MFIHPFISAKDILRELSAMGLPKSDIYDLISYISGLPYKDVIDKIHAINVKSVDYFCIMQKIKSNVPPAYITNRRGFYGREFYVDRNVLIPRYETETLIELVVGHHSNTNKQLKILDLCTGSGCILLTLLSELPSASGLGVDISDVAIDVAKTNSQRLSLLKRASFTIADILSSDFIIPVADIVTINPPYLSVDEYNKSEKSIFYEPIQALVTGDDGLYFYKNILSKLAISSSMHACLYMEIGYSQSDEIKKHAAGCGIELDTVQDIGGRDRVIWGKINNH